MSESLDRIEALLECMAQRHEADHQQMMAELRETKIITDSSVKAIAASSIAIAELRTSIAETKAITDSNARAIEAWGLRIDDERTETVDAEVELLSQIQETRQNMNDGFSQLGQAVQTVTNTLFSLMQQIADMQRRAS